MRWYVNMIGNISMMKMGLVINNVKFVLFIGLILLNLILQKQMRRLHEGDLLNSWRILDGRIRKN